jgi:hypothetical protein
VLASIVRVLRGNLGQAALPVILLFVVDLCSSLFGTECSYDEYQVWSFRVQAASEGSWYCDMMNSINEQVKAKA